MIPVSNLPPVQLTSMYAETKEKTKTFICTMQEKIQVCNLKYGIVKQFYQQPNQCHWIGMLLNAMK
eukprot:14923673-Ditylum_brightwellii.AAC.1